jgi:hypothetical protein
MKCQVVGSMKLPRSNLCKSAKEDHNHMTPYYRWFHFTLRINAFGTIQPLLPPLDSRSETTRSPGWLRCENLGLLLILTQQRWSLRGAELSQREMLLNHEGYASHKSRVFLPIAARRDHHSVFVHNQSRSKTCSTCDKMNEHARRTRSNALNLNDWSKPKKTLIRAPSRSPSNSRIGLSCSHLWSLSLQCSPKSQVVISS